MTRVCKSRIGIGVPPRVPGKCRGISQCLERVRVYGRRTLLGVWGYAAGGMCEGVYS